MGNRIRSNELRVSTLLFVALIVLAGCPHKENIIKWRIGSSYVDKVTLYDLKESVSVELQLSRYWYSYDMPDYWFLLTLTISGDVSKDDVNMTDGVRVLFNGREMKRVRSGREVAPTKHRDAVLMRLEFECDDFNSDTTLARELKERLPQLTIELDSLLSLEDSTIQFDAFSAYILD